VSAPGRDVSAPDATVAATIRPAKVVVVLNASDQDHFAVSGEGPHRTACPPWAEPTFVADHDISTRLAALLGSGEVDAVVFASNAFLAPMARDAVAQPSFVSLWNDEGPARDVGVVVLHQYLREKEVLLLEFLGSAGFSLVGERPRSVAEKDVRFAADWRFVGGGKILQNDKRFLALARGYGLDRNCVWSRFEFAYRTQWDPLAWEPDAGNPLVALCAVGHRVVAASRVPIDLTGATDMLGSLLAACLRPRGSLMVEAPTTTSSTAFSTALASAIDRQRFVYRVRPASAAEIEPRETPYCFFDELIVAPEWRIDEIAALSEEAVLQKLEQGGSIVATFTGPEQHPVAVRLSGQPQYAERANRLAAWLVPRLAQFKGDIWAMRGLMEVVKAVEAAYVDRRLIPQALRREYVREHLAGPLRDRVKRENVDDNVLATLATYSVLRELDKTGFAGLRAWAAHRLDGQVPSVIAQALTIESNLETPERLATVEAVAGGASPGQDDDVRLLRGYVAMLTAERDPDLLRAIAADRSLGLSVQAELLRAAIRHKLPPSKEIFDLTRYVRERIDQLAAGQGGLEAVCTGNAALIELARRQGIGPNAAVRGRPRETDARTVEATELVRERELARSDAEAARKVGRLAVTGILGILAAIEVAAIVWIVGWSGGDPGSKFGFATGVFAFIGGFFGVILRRARAAGIPPWPL